VSFVYVEAKKRRDVYTEFTDDPLVVDSE
jgi:hypothetical protein